MKFEKSSGAVIFREKGDLREYLLLAHKSMGEKEKIIWDFPKGLVGEGETERGTAEREVGEETGLNEFAFLEGFRETIKIFFKFQGELINKTIVFFLAQTTSEDIQISIEHTDYIWLSFEDALKKLTFKNSREVLQKASDFLNNTSSRQSLL